MALCQLRNPNALFASRELQPTWPVARLAEERLRWNAQRGPSCRALPLECSAKKSRGSGKPKTTKSNDDLCNELRQFVSAMGLPEDHVPSTKELFEHGRTKLAYVVRRRGHKEITNLLRNQTTEGTTTENDVGNDDHFGNVSTKESIDALQTQDMPDTDAESLHDETTSYRECGELKIDGDNVDTQLLSPLPRQQYSSMFNGASAVQFLDELQLSSRNMSVEEILGNSDLGGGMESDQNSVFGQSNTSHLAEEEANQAELNQLKELLRQKESELAQLKQQIEEEKFALSTMQNKAQTEISKVQNILFKTDNELQAAEESLSGLKEVLIEYCGNGETVEVAGSFNGWQHRVKMDSHASSNSNGARESILWSTILWLYPGIYEIKFVVDDHWIVDATKEFVTRGAITNNVLRVER